MKITAIKTFAVRIPLKPKRRMISALGQQGDSEYLLVRVETDAGIEGAGEATIMARWSGETVWGAQAIVDRMLAPKLIGLDPLSIREIDAAMDGVTKDNWFAKSAIEMACWDIAGKDAGKPVYDLLDGRGGPIGSSAGFRWGRTRWTGRGRRPRSWSSWGSGRSR